MKKVKLKHVVIKPKEEASKFYSPKEEASKFYSLVDAIELPKQRVESKDLEKVSTGSFLEDFEFGLQGSIKRSHIVKRKKKSVTVIDELFVTGISINKKGKNK